MALGLGFVLAEAGGGETKGYVKVVIDDKPIRADALRRLVSRRVLEQR